MIESHQTALLSRLAPRRKVGRRACTTRVPLEFGVGTARSRCAKRRETISRESCEWCAGGGLLGLATGPGRRRGPSGRKRELGRHKDHPALARGRPVDRPEGSKDMARPRAEHRGGWRGERWLRGDLADRSEERRVGKEWRSRWSPYH